MSTTTDSKAPLRQVKRVQFGILSPDEIVSAATVPIPFRLRRHIEKSSIENETRIRNRKLWNYANKRQINIH